MTSSKNIDDIKIQEDSEQAEKTPKAGTGIVAKEDEKETDELKGILPDSISQILPKETRRSVEMMMQMSGPMPNPVTKKITSEHISRIIEVTEASEMRQHEDQKDSRRWLFAFCFLGVSAFLFLVVFLADKNKDLLLELLKLFITFLGGLGAGWGIKAYKDKEGE